MTGGICFNKKLKLFILKIITKMVWFRYSVGCWLKKIIGIRPRANELNIIWVKFFWGKTTLSP